MDQKLVHKRRAVEREGRVERPGSQEMSGNPASDIIPGSSEDPKAVEFVNMLRDKTSQGKIKWTEWDHGWLASLPNNVLNVFFSTKKLPYDWTKFNVQIGADIIFQVRKTLQDSLLTMSGVSDPDQ